MRNSITLLDKSVALLVSMSGFLALLSLIPAALALWRLWCSD